MSWEKVQLKDIGNIVTGSTPSKSKPEYFDGNIPFVSPAELGKSIYVNSAKQTLSQKGGEVSRLLPKNAVMVCCIGSLGKAAISSTTVATNQQINSIIVDEAIADPLYVYFFCLTLKPVLENMAPATTVAIVNKTRFSELEIPLPPLAIQKQIAAVLEKADTLRNQCQQMGQELNTLAQSVFLYMFGDPVRNPKGWDKEPLNKVSDRIIDCPHSTPKWTESGVLCIRTSNLTKGGWDFTDERYIDEVQYESRTSRSEVESGDIILSREGTIGVAAIVRENMKLCLGQRLVQVRPNYIYLNSSFLLFQLLFQLEPQRLNQVMAGSTVQHLNMKDIRALEVIVPPVNEQAKFEKIINNLNQQKENLVNINIESQDNFNSLMQRAFKGELDLKDVA